MQWAVQTGDGERVSDIVAKMRALGSPSDARVFLNGRRADLDEPVAHGDRVDLYPRRERRDSELIQVLAQRDGVILALKPAGLPTETTKLGEDSLVSLLMGQMRSARVHAASRLDVAVSGVVLCTLGSDAAKRVEGWRAQEQLERCYLAIAAGVVDAEGEWSLPLGRMRDRAGRHKASPHARDTRKALTRYQTLARAEAQGASLLRLRPVTGRMHQLRAHAACAGAPLYGDRRYGGATSVVRGDGAVLTIERIALHAHTIVSPGLEAVAPVPEAMRTLWSTLGGEPVDWDQLRA
jgi:23S rRNA pseudouridine1911/1915/1917 synthase